jgi:spore germination protein YaaH
MKIRSLFLVLAAVLFSTNSFAAYRIAAWIPPWDASSLTSIQQHAGSLDESNPIWYSMSSTGSIVVNWNGENPTWVAAMSGTQIIPTIQNVVSGSFNGSVAATVLSTATGRENHAQEIFNLVTTKAWDGIDIDYEAVPTTSRADFTAFINTLAAKLHSAGKKLSVTVYAKTSDSQNWNGPGAQDWAALGTAADSIKLMAYDYHWSTSAAGAITPLTWLDSVVTYAESAIPAAKVIVGLPWYGYDWQASTGATVLYNDAMNLATANSATISRDVNGEATFTYGGTHTVFFQDAAAFSRKTDLIKQNHPNVGGFTCWRTGSEDAGFWSVITALRGTTTTPPPPPPPPTVAPDFTISGPSSLNLRLGHSTSGSYSITRVGGFAGTVSVTVEKVTPLDATLSLSPSTLSGTASSTSLNIASTRTTAVGTYSLRVRFTSGSLVHEQLVSVTASKH